jgi:hypothetical protein
MSTLMALVRKNNLPKFSELIPTITEQHSKHIDQSFAICIRDQEPINMEMFKLLLKHPYLSSKGFKWGVGCAISRRHRDVLRILLKDKRFTTDMVIDYILDCQ